MNIKAWAQMVMVKGGGSDVAQNRPCSRKCRATGARGPKPKSESGRATPRAPPEEQWIRWHPSP